MDARESVGQINARPDAFSKWCSSHRASGLQALFLPQLGTETLTSEMLLRPQRKFHHAFQELVRRQADEVVHDELLGVEADEVAQLQRLAARGIDEIPVPVVDHDDVALGI